ncbi:copper resistance protein NlpE [Aequorivita capsosiphonis]|uniref:copper resistance protein NlpE n=1 Tax=Aequorivita capsosiphonis TaxID=487317 RepID=UPI0004294199|nr:copper resistance protein NlpE [Aequorivita capsosiphonis]
MKKITLLFVLAATIMFSCKNDEKKEVTSEETVKDIETDDSQVIDDHNSRIALDWAGIYQGTTPCADCEGIKTVLELKDDKTYTLSQTYLGKSKTDNEFKSSGNFTWDATGSKITLKGGDSELKYKVGENQLLMLDAKGKMINRKMSDLYILKKRK